MLNFLLNFAGGDPLELACIKTLLEKICTSAFDFQELKYSKFFLNSIIFYWTIKIIVLDIYIVSMKLEINISFDKQKSEFWWLTQRISSKIRFDFLECFNGKY